MSDQPKIACPVCGVLNPSIYRNCWKCKAVISNDAQRATGVQPNPEVVDSVSQSERDQQALIRAKATGVWGNVPDSLIEETAKDIVLTTSFQLASQTIEREIAIVTAEVVYGMNVFRDLFASVRDFVGGRSKAVQKTLRDARNTVLLELKKEALMVGGDAVIAIDLDYQEITGGGKNGMIMLVASGTAVKISQDTSPP